MGDGDQESAMGLWADYIVPGNRDRRVDTATGPLHGEN